MKPTAEIESIEEIDRIHLHNTIRRPNNSIKMIRFSGFSLILVLLISLLKYSQSQGSCSATDGTCADEEIFEAPEVIVKECKDINDICALDAEDGECEKNPGWMHMNCPVSCNTCHLLDPKQRCTRANLGMTDGPAYQTGEMNKMFRDIIPRFGGVYDVEVLSESPWVVVLHNFLKEPEIKAFLEYADGRWHRSREVGPANELGQISGVVTRNRTSTQVWCHDDCDSGPHVLSVTRKIQDLIRIPYSHFENYQILRYNPGEHYLEHHDLRPYQLEWPAGPRILTFLMYLSDVEEGGETNFPRIGVKVTPKRGSAILWANALDHNLTARDVGTHHESLAVKRGLKFAANTWIHLYDYDTPKRNGCTGAVAPPTAKQ